MSTTNPPTSGSTGLPQDNGHGASGPPTADTIARGHEIDAYDTNSVLSVPLLVVLFFVLAFGTVSVIFYFIFPSEVDPSAHPMAVERNRQDITDRHDEIPAPRQDNFRLLEGNSRSISSHEKPVGNSPSLHPEDIHVNPTNTPALYKTSWLDPSKTFARISIDDAMELAIQNKNRKILPFNSNPEPPRLSTNVPTAANAGRGAGQSLASPPAIPSPQPENKKPPEVKNPPEKKKSPGGKK